MKALISFKITGRPDLHFRPFAVDGTEGLSQLYKFDIDCFGDLAKRPDTLELVGKRAMLRFELEGAEAREVFGIIKTITTGAPSNYGDARYRFQLVPWLERLNYSRASQIHGTDKEVSVVDVLESELRGGLRRETRVEDTDFRIFEHELRLRNRDSYPKRDHLVQSEETDFAFITRLAEHHGIYYFFENSGGVEKVVFADDNMFTKPIEGDIAIDWKPWGAGSRAGSPDTIQAFDETIRMMPRRMWMLDYNYRAPHVPLLASAEIDSHGLGHWVEYGSHHRTPAEGNVLARIRAEEMRSNQRRWNGKSAVARLSPGRSFKLNNHPYADWNQEYLVVSVHHEVRVPMPGVEIAEDWAGYRNSFEVIQQKTAFRPARVTPKPRMDGLMNARIDGAGQRDKAELDDQGRYRVRVPFDNSDTPDGKGSQWVRMASPFGGDGDGMHFPLAPDTEVVIACVNGDPNRPVILGAVPNPRNKSVVTKANSRQNVIATRTGMSVVMGSDGGSGGVAGGGSAAARVATPSAYGPGPDMTTPDAFGAEPVVTANDLETPPQLASSLQGQGSTSTYIALNVDDKHIIRAGAGTGDRGDGIFIDTTGKMINTIVTSLTTTVGGGETRTVTGDQTTTVKRNQTATVTGNQTTTVTGNQTTTVTGNQTITVTGDVILKATGKLDQKGATATRNIGGHDYTYVTGDKYNVTVGRTHNFFVSATMSIGVGGVLTLQLAPTLTLNLAPTIGIQLPRLTMILGTDLKFVSGADLKVVLGKDDKASLVDSTYSAVHTKIAALSSTLNALVTTAEKLSAAKTAVSTFFRGTEVGSGGPSVDASALQAKI
jgi:type VI secretion system VgrG family protein